LVDFAAWCGNPAFSDRRIGSSVGSGTTRTGVSIQAGNPLDPTTNSQIAARLDRPSELSVFDFVTLLVEDFSHCEVLAQERLASLIGHALWFTRDGAAAAPH
jgi:hypothetical protein